MRTTAGEKDVRVPPVQDGTSGQKIKAIPSNFRDSRVCLGGTAAVSEPSDVIPRLVQMKINNSNNNTNKKKVPV